MKVSAFTFIKNGEILGYPFLQSIQSILPIVDEFIINVGESEDDTLALVKSIANSKIRIIESKWNETMQDRGYVYGQQKMIALHEQVEKAVASFNTGKRKTGFSPHVTIGRTARSYGKMDVLPFLKYVYSPIELDVNSVALYESLLLPQGAKYKVLTEFPLN